MSKRFYFPQQHGERKKAKLDITISDHNFPLSQNGDRDQDNWGDDNDDEILLLASQACEQAYSGNTSTLPDYSICMQPSSTSTQIFEPTSSTSKTTFTFKKPTADALSTVSTKLRDKCELISSPLPGMSKVIQKTNPDSLAEDMIFNDKIYQSDADYVYRQLLQLREENSKLKSENGKLLEKYVTKEGEVSILRTQLKTSQMAADNARLEKIKVQEKVQMEWTDKLAAVNNQLQDLRTQLDFKNLEITSIKEKCKMLESSKVKLTQVTVAKNDISTSHRHNNSYAVPSDYLPSHLKRVKTLTKNVQTEHHTSPCLLQLNVVYRDEQGKLNQVLPLTVEPSAEQHSLLEYNEKLQRPNDSIPNRCKVFSTFHRIPNTPSPSKVSSMNIITLSDIYEDLAFISADKDIEKMHQSYKNVFRAAQSSLKEIVHQLETLMHRTTTAFQKEMDEKYIEATANFLVITDEDLVCGKPLYKEEQAITARRITAIVYHILENSKAAQLLSIEDNNAATGQESTLIELINRICTLLDDTSCAILYSGLLQSVTKLLGRVLTHQQANRTFILNVIKTIIDSRPMLFVSCETLRILRVLTSTEPLGNFCCGGNTGNLKLDYDQGVILYKKDSCFLQVLLKQIEAALKCIEKQNLIEQAVSLTRDLLLFYIDLSYSCSDNPDKPSCECRLTFLQVIVFALRICAVMLECNKVRESENAELMSVCRSGLQVLYRRVLCDLEFCPLLGYNEGHLIEFCEILRGSSHDELYCNMLSELRSALLSPEDATSGHRQPWIHSFQNFSISD
ncbi:unnamed protein product [Parnassius apollo]|uniref:(apollo) hypothetical protein n=1 Tax=Parnassius apollo TaxID=110799 RepID=A0A8S3X181_PARAO|nr:unnamed protein product [Parnassius apollo]